MAKISLLTIAPALSAITLAASADQVIVRKVAATNPNTVWDIATASFSGHLAGVDAFQFSLMIASGACMFVSSVIGAIGKLSDIALRWRQERRDHKDWEDNRKDKDDGI